MTPGWNWQKIKQALSNTLKLTFCYFKIIHLLNPSYHPEIIEDIPKKQVGQFKSGYIINDNEDEAGNEK